MSGFRNVFSNLRLFVLTLALIAIAAPVAFGGDSKHDKHGERIVARMEKELDLSKDQAAKIRAILARDSGKMPPAHGFHEGFRGPHGRGHGKEMGKGMGMGPLGGPGFAQQLRADAVDTAALNREFAAHADSMHARMLAMHARRVATFAEIHAVLTPAQRAKAADHLEKMRAKMEKRHGKN